MKMTPEQREQARLSLLRYAAWGTGWGIGIRLARASLAGEGLPLTTDEVAAEIQYLEDKGLLEPVKKLVSPENTRWRRTAAGTDYLAQQGQE